MSPSNIAGGVIELEPTEVETYEIELLARLGGSPEAFDEYMEYCGKAVTLAMYKRLGNWEDAEDVHMEALEGALGLGTPAETWLPGKGRSLKSWIWLLAGQRASKVLRKRKRELLGAADDVAELVVAGRDMVEISDGDDPPELPHRAAQVRKVIELLPEADQLFFRLKYEDRLSDEVIAEKLGVKTATVRVKTHRLLQNVKKHLQL